MTTNIIHLYETLRKSAGDPAAEAIATFINSKIDKARQRDLENLASKTDLHKAVSDLRVELKQDINELKIELKQDMSELKTDLNKTIDATKTDVVRWMFALFATVLLAIIGLYVRK